jgi:hypothetical protein
MLEVLTVVDSETDGAERGVVGDVEGGVVGDVEGGMVGDVEGGGGGGRGNSKISTTLESPILSTPPPKNILF